MNITSEERTMCRIILFCALLVCQQLIAAAGVSADSTSGQRSITVQALGFVEAVPDTLLLRLSVKHTSGSLQEAQTTVDAMVERVVSTALQNSVAAQDIDSSQLSSWPEYQWRQDKRQYMGESVQREVSLKILDLDSYGSLIGQLSELPLHRIHPPQLSHGKLEALRLQALRAALAQGRVKAQVIAGEIDSRLGLVLTVRELSELAPPGPRMMMAEAVSADNAGQPAFNLASKRITARL
jgi:uncharacterized protein YggE